MLDKKAYKNLIDLSVIISFRNEEGTIRELWERLRQTLNSLPKLNSEVIFVNDASSDNSRLIIQDIANGDNRIILMNLTRRFGVSEGVLAGMSIARGELVAYLDADLQDPPELILKMIEKQQATKVDVIHTRRAARPGESKVKLFITKLGYAYLGKFSSPPIQSELGDYKLLTRRVVDKLVEHSEPFPFLRGMIEYFGYPFEVIEYDRLPRFDGRDKTKFRMLGKRWLRTHLNSTLISFSDSLLKFMLAVGGILAVSAFAAVPLVFYMKIMGIAVPGWAGIIIAILFFQGVNLLFLGILGLYINSIFYSVKKRPVFVVESIFKNMYRKS